MSVLVKICGITNVQDATRVVQCGADAIGVVFYPPSARFVSLEVAAEICGAVPENVLRVGVFVDSDLSFIEEAVHVCGLDVVQLHGNEPPEFCEKVAELPVKVMKAFRVRDESIVSQVILYRVDYVLLDSYIAGEPGGTGVPFNWMLARRVVETGVRVFLAGGLNPTNVQSAIRAVRPYGVDVSSGVESSPGKKDARLVREFIEAVRSAPLSP